MGHLDPAFQPHFPNLLVRLSKPSLDQAQYQPRHMAGSRGQKVVDTPRPLRGDDHGWSRLPQAGSSEDWDTGGGAGLVFQTHTP